MPQIRTVRVQHFRVHESYSLTISPTVTIITGSNGSGKTSLIEALYIALRGSSFKGSDTDVLARNAPWYRIDITGEDDMQRSVKFDPEKSSGKKQFIVNEKTQYRLSPNDKIPVVLFEPDDLRLLHGSPSRRRKFIDTFISQLDPKYSQALRRYERALKQRNTLLKQAGSDDALFAWNVALSEHGAYIVNSRVEFIHALNKRLQSTYNDISHTNDALSVHYSYDANDSTAQQLLSDLHRAVDRDRILGATSAGPHRHDIIFTFNGSPALSVASRGEVRSIVLALKFLEVDIIEGITNITPVILLDDVFSELDKSRQDYLSRITKRHQVIITSATNNSSLDSSYVTTLPDPANR